MPLLSSTTFGKLWYCVLLCALNVKIAFQDKEKEYRADVTSARFLLLKIIPSLLYHFLEKRPKEISCTCAVCFLFLNPRSSKLCCFQNFLWKSRAQTKKTTKQACWLCIRRKNTIENYSFILNLESNCFSKLSKASLEWIANIDKGYIGSQHSQLSVSLFILWMQRFVLPAFQKIMYTVLKIRCFSKI